MKKKPKKFLVKQFKRKLNLKIKKLEDMFETLDHAEDVLNQASMYLRETITELKALYSEK